VIFAGGPGATAWQGRRKDHAEVRAGLGFKAGIGAVPAADTLRRVQLIRRGDSGRAVAQIQTVLTALGHLPAVPRESRFDEATDRALRGFQQQRGLVVDGIVGPETYAALQAARHRLGDRILSFSTRMLVGDDVTALQERLSELGFDTGRADGVFGPLTESALRSFQYEYGMRPDGVCGPATLRALQQLGRLVVGGRPQALRESERLHAAGSALAGKVVVVDPGHGGDDRGAVANGLDEATLVQDLAFRLEGRLQAMGVRALLTRGWDSSPTDTERAGFANAAGADVVLSLHVDQSRSPRCEGVASYHFGIEGGTTSTEGERLASLVQRELVARTGLLDCRVHAKTWTLLRLTQMPAVRTEVGHLTHAGDAGRLADPAFRDTVAEGLLVAVQRLYLPQESDPATGVLRLPTA
jgi:N-acetylmuramoyl-L-alanine amidase